MRYLTGTTLWYILCHDIILCNNINYLHKTFIPGTGYALPIGNGKRIPGFINQAGIRTDEWQPVAKTLDL